MESVGTEAPRGFRGALRDPVGGKLLLAGVASEAGDYIGTAALILLTYHATHSVMGPAAVSAASTLPTLLVGTVFGHWLDRPARRSALVVLNLIGAAACAAVAAVPVFALAVVVSFVLGATRCAYVGIAVGAVSDSVPDEGKPAYFTLLGTLNDTAQIVGFLTGSALTLAVGASWAMGLDAVSFVAGSAVLWRLPQLPRAGADHSPGPAAGLRTILTTRPLRLLTPVVAITMFGSALPETLAPKLADGVALPFVMVAYPVGSILAGVVVVRRGMLGSIGAELRLAFLCGVSFATGALAVWAHVGPWPVAGANFVVGAATIWLVAARTTFAQETPKHLMAQVEATMIGTLTVAAGVGTLALSGLATAFGAGWAYAAEAVLGVAFASAALVASRR